MKKLVLTFLKIFFRNPRAIFFVIFLPVGIFCVLALLNLETIVRFSAGMIYKDFLLSGMIAVALMQSGIYTIAYSLIDYQRTKVLKRLSLTPLSPERFLVGQVISRFIIAAFQVLLLVLLGFFVFRTTLKVQGLILLPLVVFLGSTIFLNLGVIIAAIARNYEEAAPYTTFLGLCLTFFGDVFFPSGQLPTPLPQVASFLPLKPLSDTLRATLIEGNYSNLRWQFVAILVWFATLQIVAGILFRERLYK